MSHNVPLNIDRYSYVSSNSRDTLVQWGNIYNQTNYQTAEILLPIASKYRLELTIENVELTRVLSLPYVFSSNTPLTNNYDVVTFVQTIDVVNRVLTFSQKVIVIDNNITLDLTADYKQSVFVSGDLVVYKDLPIGDLLCRIYLPGKLDADTVIYYPAKGIGLMPARHTTGLVTISTIEDITLGLITALGTYDDNSIISELRTLVKLGEVNNCYDYNSTLNYVGLKGLPNNINRLTLLSVDDVEVDLESNSWLSLWMIEALNYISNRKPAAYLQIEDLRERCKALLDGIATSLLQGFTYSLGTIATAIDAEGIATPASYTSTILTVIILQELNKFTPNDTYVLVSHYIYKNCLSLLPKDVTADPYSIFSDYSNSKICLVKYLWQVYTNNNSLLYRESEAIALSTLVGVHNLYRDILDLSIDYVLLDTSSNVDFIEEVRAGQQPRFTLTNPKFTQTVKSTRSFTEYVKQLFINSWPYGTLWTQEELLTNEQSALGGLVSAVSDSYYKYILDLQAYRNSLNLDSTTPDYLFKWSEVHHPAKGLINADYWREWLISYQNKPLYTLNSYLTLIDLLGFESLTKEFNTEYGQYSLPTQTWINELPSLNTIDNKNLDYSDFLDLVYDRTSVDLDSIDYSPSTLLNVSKDTLKSIVGIKQSFLLSTPESVADSGLLLSADYRSIDVTKDTSKIVLRGKGDAALVYKELVDNLPVGTFIELQMFTSGKVKPKLPRKMILYSTLTGV